MPALFVFNGGFWQFFYWYWQFYFGILTAYQQKRGRHLKQPDQLQCRTPTMIGRIERNKHENQGCPQAHKGYDEKSGVFLSYNPQRCQVHLPSAGTVSPKWMEFRPSLYQHHDHRPLQSALPDVSLFLLRVARIQPEPSRVYAI
jgi:hypothetical protein